DRGLDPAREERSPEARRAHRLLGRPLRPFARAGDLAGRRRARAPALRRGRARRGRSPSADPALPASLAPGRPGRLPRRALDSLEAAAARASALGRDGVRLVLELVVKRLEARRLAGAVRDRLREHPVREPGVAWKQRSVEVRADRASDAAALVAAL